jgi:hypothetical protein
MQSIRKLEACANECRAKDDESRAHHEEIERLRARNADHEKTLIEKDQAMHDLIQEKDFQIQDIKQQASVQLEAAEHEIDGQRQEERKLRHRIEGLLEGSSDAPPYQPAIYGGRIGIISLDEEMTDPGYDSGYDEELDCIE